MKINTTTLSTILHEFITEVEGYNSSWFGWIPAWITSFCLHKRFSNNFMTNVLFPASEIFWVMAILQCIVVWSIWISLLTEDTAGMYILKFRYEAIKFWLFFFLCFCLSLFLPLPVFNFLINSCWQLFHFTSIWQIKQTPSLRGDANVQADQKVCYVATQPASLCISLCSPRCLLKLHS